MQPSVSEAEDTENVDVFVRKFLAAILIARMKMMATIANHFKSTKCGIAGVQALRVNLVSGMKPINNNEGVEISNKNCFLSLQ